MGLKKIKLITKVAIDFSDLKDEAQTDILDLVGSVGHEDIPFELDWSDEDDYPHLKSYLTLTYGEEIRNHESFLLESC